MRKSRRGVKANFLDSAAEKEEGRKGKNLRGRCGKILQNGSRHASRSGVLGNGLRGRCGKICTRLGTKKVAISGALCEGVMRKK